MKSGYRSIVFSLLIPIHPVLMCRLTHVELEKRLHPFLINMLLDP